MTAQEAFHSGDDAAHSVVNETGVDAHDFFEHAQKILVEQMQIVQTEVIPHLEDHQGKWHPLGFMVFPLGVSEQVGALRLHIWPANHRVARGTGPGIHDHAWHLVSYVLNGTYTDEIYELEEIKPESEADRAANSGLNTFTVQYQSGQPDTLMADGHCVRAIRTEARTVIAGDIHTIKAGAFHVSHIPLDQMTATLVLDSPSLGFAPRVLLDTSEKAIYDSRQEISRDEAVVVKQWFA